MPLNTRSIYSKFILALGFMLFAAYSYYMAGGFSLKVWCCLGVGIGYVIYGIYTYKQERKKGTRG